MVVTWLIRLVESKPRLKKLYLQQHNPEYTSVYLSYSGNGNIKPVSPRRERKRESLVLKPEAIGRFEEFLTKAATTGPGFRYYPDALDYILKLRDYLRRIDLIATNYLPSVKGNKLDTLTNAAGTTQRLRSS